MPPRLPPRVGQRTPQAVRPGKKSRQPRSSIPSGVYWAVGLAVAAAVLVALGFAAVNIYNTAYKQAQVAAKKDATTGSARLGVNGEVLGRVDFVPGFDGTLGPDGWAHAEHESIMAIDLPAAPMYVESPIQIGRTKSELKAWRCRRESDRLSAMAGIVDGNNLQDPQERLAEAREKLTNGSSIVSERPISLQEIDGLEIELDRGELRTVLHLYAKGWLWIIEVTGPGVTADNRDAARIFDSVELRSFQMSQAKVEEAAIAAIPEWTEEQQARWKRDQEQARRNAEGQIGLQRTLLEQWQKAGTGDERPKYPPGALSSREQALQTIAEYEVTLRLGKYNQHTPVPATGRLLRSGEPAKPGTIVQAESHPNWWYPATVVQDMGANVKIAWTGWKKVEVLPRLKVAMPPDDVPQPWE